MHTMIDEFSGDFLQWLRGFYYVAKTGSVSLATLEMGRNQPAISHQIKSIENEFGVTLFDRSRGRMALTPEGKKLFEKSISLFELIKEMEAEVDEGRLEHEGKIQIASTHAVIEYSLSQRIVDYKLEHPDVNFEIIGGGVNVILDKVESSEADFGIANFNKIPDGLVFHELFETVPKLIAPKNNPFFKSKHPTLKQISQIPFILFPNTSTLTTTIRAQFAENGLEPRVVLVLNNFDIVKRFVELGMGISILDEFTITQEDYQRLDIFPLERYFNSRMYGKIMRKRKYFSPAVRAFLRSIKPDIEFEK